MNSSHYLLRIILVAMLAVSIREASSLVSCHSSTVNVHSLITLIISLNNDMIQEQNWCVAKRNAPEAKLEQFIREVCSPSLGSLALDCSKIAAGGACYEPNTTRDHASYILNLSYKFRGECKPEIGILVNKNPCK